MIKNFLKENSIHKKIVPYLDIIFIFSPISFFVTWILICIGMYLNTFFPISFFQETTLYIFQFNVYGLFLFSGISFLISSIKIKNIINDKSNHLNFLIKNYSIHKIRLFTLSISFIFLFIVNWKIFILGVIIFLIMEQIYYNNKIVFSFKNILCNSLVYFLIIYAGFIYSYGNNSTDIISYELLILIFSYILCFTGVSFIYDIFNSNYSDIIKKSCILIAILLIFTSLIISLYFNDPLLSTSIIVSSPFFFYALIRNLEKDIIRTIRYPLAILSFFMMVIFPYLFFAELILFYLCKYYYWHRLDIHYPTFLIDD